MKMLVALLVGALMGFGLARPALSDTGDAAKAKAMLAQVVVAVKKDQPAAMKMFTAGSDGFKDGNIYPFCFNLSDGVVITGQTAGQDIRGFAKADGGGQKMFDAAQKPEGTITEVTYMARKPAPADATPVKKVSVVQRIGTIGCGVGYYP